MVPDDELARAVTALPLPAAAFAARDALLAGRPVEALERLDALGPPTAPGTTAPAPGTAPALHLRGLAHLLRGDLYRAADAFQAATHADPTLFEPLYRLGSIQVLREEHAQAVRTLRAALERQPDHAGAIAALAECHTRQSEPVEAENLARRGLVFAPDSTALLVALAGGLRNQSRHAEAVPVLRRALGLAGDEPRIKVALGRSLLALNRPAEARPLFEQVLRRNTEHVGALSGMAEALEMEGRLADAHGYVLRAVAAAPDRAALHVLNARIHLRSGRLQAAEDAAAMASTLAPGDPTALRIAMRAATDHHRLRRAAAYAEQLRALAGDDPEALAALALACLLDDRRDDARSILSRARDAATSSDAQRALGCLELTAGRAAAAAAHLTEALRLRGDDTLAQRLLESAWEVVADPDLDAAGLVRQALDGAGEARATPPGALHPVAERPMTGPIAPLVQAAMNRLLGGPPEREKPRSPPAVERLPRPELTPPPRPHEPPTLEFEAPTGREASTSPAEVPDGVLTRLHRLRHLLRAEPNLSDLLGQITELIESHDSPLLLAVFGPRGAGKTAFVNALIGEPVIADDTALPHLVRYGRRTGGRVVHRDGRVEALGLTALSTALAERRLTPDDVRWIEILLPVEELVRASILDAPDPLDPGADDGLSRRADAVLWLVGADQPAERWAEAAHWLARQPLTAIGVLTCADRLAPSEVETRIAAAQALLGDRVEGFVAVSAHRGIEALRERDVGALKASGFVRLHRLMQAAFFSRAGQIRAAVTRARLAEVVEAARQRVAERVARLDAQADAVRGLAHRVESDRRIFAGSEEARAVRALEAAIDEAVRHAAVEVTALHRDHGGAFTRDQLVTTLRDQLRDALAAAVDRVRASVDERLEGLIRGYFEAFEQVFPGAAEKSAEAARVAGLQGILDGYRLLMLEEAFGRHRAYLEGWIDQAPLEALLAPGRALARADRGELLEADMLVIDLRRHGLRLDAARPPRLAGLGRPLFDGLTEFVDDTTTELRLARIAVVKRLVEPLARLGSGLET